MAETVSDSSSPSRRTTCSCSASNKASSSPYCFSSSRRLSTKFCSNSFMAWYLKVCFPGVMEFRRGILGGARLTLQLPGEAFPEAETAGFGNILGHLVYDQIAVDAIGGRVANVF